MMAAAPHRRSGRRGFTLLEVSISTALVAVLLVTSMQSLGAATRSRRRMADLTRASLLGQELVSEIVSKTYAERVQPAGFGPESTEADGTRQFFDDVDDFHGWDASPPQQVDGAAISGHSGWRQQVTVAYVLPADLTSVVMTDQRAKRITVTISRNGAVLRELVAVRTDTDQE